MLTRTAWLVLLAALLGSACSTATVTGTRAVDASAAERLVPVVDATLSTDGSEITLRYIGTSPYREDDPCTALYEGRTRVDGDVLVVAVEMVVARGEHGASSDYECTDLGYNSSVTVDIDPPYFGSVLRDEAGYTLFLSPPDGLAELAGLGAEWELDREESLPESRTGRWSRVYTSPSGRLEFIQAFDGPAEVGLGGDDERRIVAVGGTDGVLYRHAESGLLLLVWRPGPHGFALGVNEAVMSEGNLIALAESVTDPDAPASFEPIVASGGAPPDLVLVSGSEQIAIPSFDYCWDNPETGDGSCADSFGGEVPTPASIQGDRVEIRWLGEGSLAAWYRIDDSCTAPLPVELLGPGRWSLDMPPEPGTHRIDLSGRAPHGDTRFAFLATTSAPGPPPAPIATIWWPNIGDELAVSVRLERVVAGATASLEVAGSGANPIVLDLDYRLDSFVCLPSLSGSAEVDDLSVFGEAPFTITLRATSGLGSYTQTWEWPGDLTPDGELVGVMEVDP